MNRFTDLSLCASLQSNLTKHAFVVPTPVQAEAIPPAMEGRDVVATAQTGTGKTLAFLLPIVQALVTAQTKPGAKPAHAVQALILAPTRELALQILETANKLTPGTGLHAAVAVGGMNENTQLAKIRAGVQILIATPGRLNDFLDRKLVPLGHAGVVVLDEADRMLDMGFLPTLKRILKHVPKDRQTMLFSATIETSVAHLIRDYVTSPVRIAIGAITKPTDGIDLHVYEVEQDRKQSLLEKLLREEDGSFLVFARTKHGTDRLAKRLSASGFDTARIHGNRTQNQRNQALDGFKKGDYRVLVATDVAARGIHVDDIAHVVNYDLPQVPEDFIHRVGRTGRAGARGTASTFATSAERGDIRKIEATMKMRLTPREIVLAELPREEKKQPPAAQPASRPASQKSGQKTAHSSGQPASHHQPKAKSKVKAKSSPYGYAKKAAAPRGPARRRGHGKPR